MGRMDSGFRRNDERLSVMNHAPTEIALSSLARALLLRP